MKEIKIRKTSKNGMPTWDSLLPFVLKYVIDKKICSRIEIRVDVADSLNLPENLRNLRYDSKWAENVVENRIDFAISALKIGGAIENVSRGKYSATTLGSELFDRHGYNLTSKIVESTEPYIEY